MAIVSGPANAAVRCAPRQWLPQTSIYLLRNAQADPERYDD
jgi:hypothetical protein